MADHIAQVVAGGSETAGVSANDAVTNPASAGTPAEQGEIGWPWMAAGAVVGLAVWAALVATGGTISHGCLTALAFGLGALLIALVAHVDAEAYGGTGSITVCVLATVAGLVGGWLHGTETPDLRLWVVIASGGSALVLGLVLAVGVRSAVRS